MAKKTDYEAKYIARLELDLDRAWRRMDQLEALLLKAQAQRDDLFEKLQASVGLGAVNGPPVPERPQETPMLGGEFWESSTQKMDDEEQLFKELKKPYGEDELVEIG